MRPAVRPQRAGRGARGDRRALAHQADRQGRRVRGLDARTSPASRASPTARRSCSARCSARSASTPAAPSASRCSRSTPPSRSSSSSRSEDAVTTRPAGCPTTWSSTPAPSPTAPVSRSTRGTPRPSCCCATATGSRAGSRSTCCAGTSTWRSPRGMCVFPGGGVDKRDFDADIGWVGPTPARVGGAARHRRGVRPGPGLRRGAGDVRGVRRAAGRADHGLGRRGHHRRRLGGGPPRAGGPGGLLHLLPGPARPQAAHGPAAAVGLLGDTGLRAAAVQRAVLRRRAARPVRPPATSPPSPTTWSG